MEIRNYQLVYPVRDRKNPLKYCYTINIITDHGDILLLRNFTSEDYKTEEGGLQAFLRYIANSVLQDTIQGKESKFTNRDKK